MLHGRHAAHQLHAVPVRDRADAESDHDLYEYVHTSRHIYLNSKHPEGKIQWFMGDSRGRWDGDSLVVDVVHFTDQNWFDRSGNYHSDSMHLVERWTRTGADHLWYKATIEDP